MSAAIDRYAREPDEARLSRLVAPSCLRASGFVKSIDSQPLIPRRTIAERGGALIVIVTDGCNYTSSHHQTDNLLLKLAVRPLYKTILPVLMSEAARYRLSIK
eukprot:scaffold571177_cov18-Prasinocladus_malaysianus.AAC.1